MRRVILIAVAGLGLAGCSSFSMDYFRSAPPPVTVQLESAPQGAEARTSLGPGCKTPCSVSVPAAENFTVTYTLNKFQPLTVPVQIIRIPGDFSTPASATIDPNPVVGELQPAVPLKPVRKPMRPKKPKSKPAVAPAASPFPTPAAPAPAPTR
jgi:hypothetical protein